MTIRTPREITAAIKAERSMRDITYTDRAGTLGTSGRTDHSRTRPG